VLPLKYITLTRIAQQISTELQIIQQGTRLKDIVKKFQTVRLAFNEQQCFIRDVCFRVSFPRYTIRLCFFSLVLHDLFDYRLGKSCFFEVND
jgi:hypothetical protein